MKNIFKTLTIFTLTMLLVQSCSKDDKIIDGVFDGVQNGAILRVINFVSADISLGAADARFEVLLEEQDNQGGALFQEIRVAGDFAGGTSQFIKTVPATDFAIDPSTNLPRGTVMVTLDELATTLGVDTSTLGAGDFFNIHLTLVLTDGREYSAANTGANVSGGQFYNSPFQFLSNIVCPVPEDFMAGDYTMAKTTPGEDPFFPNYGQGITTAPANITLVANGVDRDFTYVYYPTSFAINNPMTFSLVCGQIQVAGGNGLSCDGGTTFLGQNTPATPSMYNLADDTSFTVDFNDFDPDAGCGSGSYPVTVQMTKQ